MKNSKLLTIVVILLIGIFAWNSYASQRRSLTRKWEYKIVYTASEDELNRLGTQGWEVTTAYVGLTNGTGSTPYCVLKRPK